MKAEDLDMFLRMLLKEYDYGYLRYGAVMEVLKLKSRVDVVYMVDFINKRFPGAIGKNEDLELWIDANRYSEILNFMNNGGFTRENQKNILEVEVLKTQIKYNREATKISWISLIVASLSFLIALYNLSR